MRVALFYNRHAGDQLPLDHIRDVITRHRHELVCVVESESEFDRLLQARPEIVAAAGGDGTIAVAARLLAHVNIPLSILALGTANNIAKSLGSAGDIDEIIGRWGGPDVCRSISASRKA